MRAPEADVRVQFRNARLAGLLGPFHGPRSNRFAGGCAASASLVSCIAPAGRQNAEGRVDRGEGLIRGKAEIDLGPEGARYTLEIPIPNQRDRKKRRLWRSGRATDAGVAMASDACGPLVWSTVSGDRNMFGDAKASATVAEAPRPRKWGDAPLLARA